MSTFLIGYTNVGMSLRRLSSLLLVLIALLCSDSSGASTYFIQGQPGWDQPNKRPYPAVIHRLDEGDTSLTPVWSLPENHKAWSIGVYRDPGLVVISEGDWFPENIHLIPTTDVSESRVVPLEEYRTVSKYRVWESIDKSPVLQVLHRDNATTTLRETLLKVEPTRVRQVSRSDFVEGQIRMAGAQNARSGGKSDVAGARLQPEMPISLVEAGITLDGSPVPADIMKTNSSRGWVLVANESNHRALWCVPDSHGPTQRELLIYDRASDTWKSVMVEGSSTMLRPIGLWLVGVVADTSPETDFHGGGGVPPILRDEVALVNLVDGRSFTAPLGQDCEILLIEDAIVYYRSGEKLHRALIDGEAIIDATELLSSPVVGQIHWGFATEE